MTIEDLPQKNAAPYFAGLDLVRVIGALMVVMFHFTYLASTRGADVNPVVQAAGGMPIDFRAIAPVSWMGWSAVQIFFVISGIVSVDSVSGRSAWAFIRSRVGRLLPGIILCATVSFATALIVSPKPLLDLVKLYLGTVLVYPQGYNGVYWTLRVEIAFYGLVVLLLCLNIFRFIDLWAGLLTLASFAFWAGFNMAHGMPSLNFAADFMDLLHSGNALLDATLHFGCFFTLGIYLTLIRTRGSTPIRLLMLALSILCGVFEINDFSYAFRPEGTLGGGPVLVWLALLAGVVLSLHHWDMPPRLEATLRALGLMTYPLYLVHDYMGEVVLGKLYGQGINPWAAALLAAALAIAISFAILIFGEKPLRTRVHQIIDGIARKIGHSKILTCLSRPTGKVVA